MSVYKGIDVSRWQGDINWSLVRNSGIQFAMLRATYGTGGFDLYFKQNYPAARKVGIAVGAYHFAYALTPEQAVAEAEHCHSKLKGKKFEYPIAYDMEYEEMAKLGKTKISAIAKAFCEKMEEYGYYVCIYASKHWLENYFTDEILKRYDIWLAQWSDKPTYSKAYGIWQKTSKGRVDGIEGNVDLDESYKNYPAIMKYNGLNGYGSEDIEVKPPQRGYAAGQKIYLKNARLYSSAYTNRVSNYITGTYYIYDGIYFEGRFRVTNSVKNVERKPISKYVTGFVHRDDIKRSMGVE